MQPYLIMCNVNSADVMPMWSTCTAIPNDILHGVHETCVLVSWVSLHNIDVLHYTYLTEKYL